MNHFTLFQLTDTAHEIVQDLIDAQIKGDTHEVEALIQELNNLYKARTEKHEAYVHVIKNAEATAHACKAEADAFIVRARALDNLSKRLKSILLADLHQHSEKTAPAGKFKIARQAGQPRVVVHVEVSQLPDDYQRITIEADKTALKDALKAGDVIDGVELEDTEHIRIRVR